MSRTKTFTQENRSQNGGDFDYRTLATIYDCVYFNTQSLDKFNTSFRKRKVRVKYKQKKKDEEQMRTKNRGQQHLHMTKISAVSNFLTR